MLTTINKNYAPYIDTKIDHKLQDKQRHKQYFAQHNFSSSTAQFKLHSEQQPNRQKQFFWSTVLTMFFLMAFFFAANVQANTLTLTPKQVGEHSYYFQGESGMATAENAGYMSNAGFVVTDDGVVVFDALGTPALGEAMIAAIAEVTEQPIKLVIISHYHADHFYGLQAFEALGVESWGHQNGLQYLNSELAQERLEQRQADLAPWVDENTQLLAVDKWLEFPESGTIDFSMGGLDFVLYDVGGAHAPDDIMLYVPADDLLFAGDVFFTGRIPFVGDADSKAWLAALDRLLEINAQRVVPGHGPDSVEPDKDIALTRDYLLFLREQFGQAVEEMIDFETAYENIDWSRFENEPAFESANRINSYGQYLVMERESLENF